MEKTKWIPMKIWRLTEAEREQVSEFAIGMRLSRGKYPHLNIKRENARVVFVEVPYSHE